MLLDIYETFYQVTRLSRYDFLLTSEQGDTHNISIYPESAFGTINAIGHHTKGYNTAEIIWSWDNIFPSTFIYNNELYKEL